MPAAVAEPSQLERNAFVISEDDWRQCEFLSAALGYRISQAVRRIQEIRTESAGAPGFTRVYVREGLDEPLADAGLQVSHLLDCFGPADQVYDAVRLREHPGVIPSAFAFRADECVVYGTAHADVVECVGFSDSRGTATSPAMTDRVGEIMRFHQLVLGNWQVGRVEAPWRD